MLKVLPTWQETKKILSVMLPIIIGQILVIVVGFVDNFMVGLLPEKDDAVAAVGIANEIILVATSLIFGINGIIMSFLSQYYSNKRNLEFRDTMKLMVSLSLFFTIILIAIIDSLTSQIVSIFDHESTSITKDLAIPYIRFMSIGVVIFSVTYSYLTGLLALGKVWYTALISFISLILNILFDYVFMSVLSLGIEGAAFSTIIARGVELIVALFIIRSFHELMVFRWNLWKQNKQIFSMIIRRWVFFLTNMLFNIGLVSLTIVWMRGYNDTRAGVSVGYVVAGILFSIFPAITTVIKISVGYHLGRYQFELAKATAHETIKVIVWFSFIISLLGIASAFFVPGLILDNEINRNAARNMIIIYASLLLMYVLPVCFLSILESGGIFKLGLAINGFFQICVALPIAIICTYVWKTDFIISFLFTQLSQIIVVVVSMIAFLKYKWLQNIVETQRNIDALEQVWTTEHKFKH